MPLDDSMRGKTLGRYRLAEPIGQGGMGVVYRATDTRLGRTVAIKVLPPAGQADQDRRRRFLLEARTASALNNPHIVTIHDALEEGGVDYIVMELVQGRPLDAILREGRLPVDRAMEYARQIASSLAAAHGAGIVHRDLKPQNVMVTRENLVKVLDFGLAKVTHPDIADTQGPTMTAGLTQQGQTLGTPAYMSPEQIEGRKVDARSDVFSFGIVLYEMLAGRRPFPGTTIASLARDIVFSDPEPVTRSRPEVPVEVAKLVERALSKDPAGRFADGAELKSAIEAIQTGEAATSRPLASRLRSGLTLTARRLRPGRGVAGIVIALLVVAGAFVARPFVRGLFPTRGEGSETAAMTPYDLYRSGMEDLSRYFEEGRIDDAIERFQRAVAADPNYAPGFTGLSLAYWRKFRVDKDESQLDRSLQYARNALQLDPQLAAAHTALGLAAVEAGKLDEAETEFELARQLDPLDPSVHRGLAELHLARKEMPEAEAAIDKAIELAPDDWEMRQQRGRLYYRRGMYKEAAEAFRAGAALAPDNPVVYRNLGAALHMMGDYPGAAASFQKSLQIKPDPLLYGNLGTLYFFQGLYAQAAGAFERSVELGPNNYMNWRNLGDAYRMIPDKDGEARDAYTRAIQLIREKLEAAPGDPDLRSNLALCLARSGAREEAFREASRLFGMDSAAPLVYYRLILTFESIGERESAIKSLGKALDAGYSIEEIKTDPELVGLRSDVRYHRLLLDRTTGGNGDQEKR